MKVWFVRFLSLLLTMMISSTMALSHATEMKMYGELDDQLFLSAEQALDTAYATKNDTNKSDTRFLKKLEGEILRTEEENEHLSDTITRMGIASDENQKNFNNQITKLLSKPRKLKRFFKRARRHDRALTLKNYVSNLKLLTNPEIHKESKEKLLAEITEAGSYAEYLKSLRQKFENNEQEKILPVDGVIPDIINLAITITMLFGPGILVFFLVVAANSVFAAVAFATLATIVAVFCYVVWIVWILADGMGNKIQTQSRSLVLIR